MLCSDFTAKKKKTKLSMALGNGYRKKSLLIVTMQAVSHNCNWPDGVVSGIHVVTTPYMRYWSFYCSTVARNWTVSILYINESGHALRS